jgi:ribonuclease HI
MKHIQIYTDGACRGNPGPGGWGALLRYGDKEKKLYGAVEDTTNNRMEMTAAIEAIKAIKEKCIIDLYTDSEYLKKGVQEWMPDWKKRNWKKADKKPVKNADLWQALDEVITSHQIAWHWVKGHSGHTENEIADGLANQAIDEMLEKKSAT